MDSIVHDDMTDAGELALAAAATRKRSTALPPGRISAVLITLALCVGALEIGLRIIGRYEMNASADYFAENGVSFALKPNVKKRVVLPAMTFKVYTSPEGVRVPKPGSPNMDQPYYVAFGASDVFGNGLDYEETFVGVLAGKLAENKIGVVNMGVAGHHFLEQDFRFREITKNAKRSPAAVLLFLNPLIIGGYDDVHADCFVSRGQIWERADWKRAFVANWMSDKSAAVRYFRDFYRKVQGKMGKKDFSVDFYIQRYSSKHRLHDPKVKEDFLNKLKDFEKYVRSLNAEPICVYLPPVGGMYVKKLVEQGKIDAADVDIPFWNDLVREHCQAEGVRYINVEPLLQEKYDRGEKLNFDLDAHYNAKTSKVLGEFLYAQLMGTPR